MSAFLVAPTEPLALRALGITSGLPERHGCDVLWRSSAGELGGVQRKTLADLWASVQDGRLSREVARMAELSVAGLVLEGRWRWSAAGRLTTARVPLTRAQLRGMLLSVQQRGIGVVQADDVADTCGAIADVRRWHEKPSHTSLDLRPRPAAGPPTRAWAVHLLQSFPLVGPAVAGAIHDHFAGVPLAWTRTATSSPRSGVSARCGRTR